MTTAQVTLAVALSPVLLLLGLVHVAVPATSRRAAAHLGMSPGLHRLVGTLEAAGAVGPLRALASTPLGMAAATGPAPVMAAAAVVRLPHGDPCARTLPTVVLARDAVMHAGIEVAVGRQAGGVRRQCPPVPTRATTPVRRPGRARRHGPAPSHC